MVVKQHASASARILVIDDDPALMRESINALYVCGYEVETCGPGMAEPVRAIPTGWRDAGGDPIACAVNGQFDVVIMDADVPGADPFALIDALQASASTPVIILMGEEPKREMVIAALRGGAFEFLLKPFSTDRLLEAIHLGLDNRRAFFQILNLSRRLEEANRAYALERDQLMVSNRTLRRLTECVQAVAAALTTEEMIQALTQNLPSIVSYDRVALAIFQHNARWVHVPYAAHDALTCHPLSVQRAAQGTVASDEPAGDGSHGAGVRTEVSLQVLDDQIGYMTLYRRGPAQAFTPQESDVLTMVGNSVSLAIRNVEAHRRVQTLAVTDGLTGLLNHRAFSNILSREFIKTTRYLKPLSLIMIDVDSFKTVNDRYGHPAGDRTLREFARLCSEVVRDVDIVARYGGDEFAVILPDTELHKAVTVADRIQDAVVALRPAGGSDRAADSSRPERVSAIGFTVSMGVASCPHRRVASADDLLSQADKALYLAKAGGRNRIRVVEPEALSLSAGAHHRGACA